MQPGGRPPAPGQLAVVQAFLNTHFDLVGEHGAEVLSSPAALSRWLAGHQLLTEPDPPSATGQARRTRHARPADLARALELRNALRALARANARANARARSDPRALARLDAAAAGLPCALRFGA